MSDPFVDLVGNLLDRVVTFILPKWFTAPLALSSNARPVSTPLHPAPVWSHRTSSTRSARGAVPLASGARAAIVALVVSCRLRPGRFGV